MKLRRVVLFLIVFLIALVPVTAYAANGADDDEFVLRINGDQRIDTDDRVSVAVLIDGNAAVAGTLSDLLIVVSGNITVEDAGLVEGDIWLVDGELCVEEGGLVSADIYLADDAVIEEGCAGTITGEIFTDSFDFDLNNEFAIFLTIFYVSSWFGFTLVMLLGAFVFAGIGGRQLWDSAGFMTSRIWQSILAGVVLWVVTPFLITLLFFTLFGAPIALLLAVIASLLWLLGLITAGTRIGAILSGRSTSVQEQHPYLPAIAGALVLQLVMLVATAGLLIVATGFTFASDDWGFFLLIGIPVGIVWILLWLLGIWGSGSLVVTALRAWRAGGGDGPDEQTPDDVGQEPASTSEPADDDPQAADATNAAGSTPDPGESAESEA